jgi:uncharacterized lipoprotein YddW (UPF0748 family)
MMLGQGRPLALLLRTRWSRWWCGLALMLWCCSSTLLFAQQSPTISDATDWSVQFRVAWGGGSEQLWQGEISVDPGAVQFVRALGIEADEPGTMYSEQGRLFIKARSVRAYDGVDLRVPYDPAAKLTVRLTNASGVQLEESIPLEELLHKSWQKKLDERGNRLFIRRLPSDQLRLQTARTNLIFAPREVWNLEIVPHLLPIAETTPTKIKARLVQKGSTTDLWTQEFPINQWTRDWSKPANPGSQQPSIPFQVTLPEADGVYELILEAHERGPLRWGKVALTRTVQVIVVNPQTPKPSDNNSTWQKILELDPTNNSWIEKFRNSWAMLPGMRPGSIHNNQSSVQQLPGLGAVVQLNADQAQDDPAWDAYPLAITKPGQPHQFEIEYPQHLPQALSVTILEPNVAGQIQPLGIDSGLQVTEDQRMLPAGWARHKVVFWPRTKTPLVLITNRSGSSPAYFGKLRVWSGPANLPVLAGMTNSQRTLGASWLRPMFPDQFQATKALDSWSGRALDDWQTFYEGSTRLLEYSRYAGYNLSVVNVWADGSTLYPSDLLQPTPRYDTGVFFDQGHDPRRKDIAELLCRLADRQGQRLLLGLQFASPLPELEELQRTLGDRADGIALIGKQGQAWSAINTPRRGLAPYYNPLDERVQQAIQRVVLELVQRYHEHPSFAGVHFELHADSYLQLPGEDWGLDDRTFNRFLTDKKLSFPAIAKPEERFAARARQIEQDVTFRAAWLAWRSAELHRFYNQLQTAVRAVRADATILLTPTNTYDISQLQSDLLPRLNQTPAKSDVIDQLAWQTKTENAATYLWLHSRSIAAPSERTRQALLAGWQEQTDATLQALPTTGYSFYHEPQRLRLASFDQRSPFGKEKTYLWQLTTFSKSGVSYRQHLTEALAQADHKLLLDQGIAPALGQESALTEWLLTYTQLPAVPFQTISQDLEPVVIRRAVANGQTYYYFVNRAPWPVAVQFEMPVQAASQMVELSGLRTLTKSPTSKQQFPLQPHDLWAIRIPDEVSISQISLNYPADLARDLEARLKQVRQRRALLEQPPLWSKLPNPEFENGTSAERIPGWQIQITDANQARVQLITELPKTGKQALQVTNSANVTSVIRSDTFDAPTTGRLSLSIWIKNLVEATQPAVRIAIEGIHQDQLLTRYAVIGGTNGPVPLRSQWSQYILQIDDLPVTGLQQLYVRVDLQGVGSIAMDDLQLQAFSFNETERRQLDKSLTLIEYQLQNGQLGRGWQELNRYWPSYLMRQIPASMLPVVSTPIVEQAPATPPVAPATNDNRPADKQATKPGMMERVREFWRF